MNNPLHSRAAYEQFLYTLPTHYSQIQSSTLRYVPSGAYFGRIEGLLRFETGLILCVIEYVTFLQHGEIEQYRYEVSRPHHQESSLTVSDVEYCTIHYAAKDKLYWYDSQPHPDDPALAATYPHHKHIQPEIKHHRVPAPGLSFTEPNLPWLIQEIIRM
jgi:hypothetical protein